MKTIFMLLGILMAINGFAQTGTDLPDIQATVPDSLQYQPDIPDSSNIKFLREKALSEQASYREFLMYAYESNQVHRVGIGQGGKFYKGLYYESILGLYLSQITDPYNDDKGNCSIIPQLAWLSSVCLKSASEKQKTDKEYDMSVSFSKLPTYLTCTMFYVPLTPEPYDAHKFFSPPTPPSISVFVKNDTDWFMFRKHQWVQITPGAGIRLYFCSLRELSIAAGMQYNIQSDFQGKPRTDRNYFFRVGFYPPSD